MNIVLTGGAGDLGQAVSPALLERGHEVTCLDLRASPIAGVVSVKGSMIDDAILQSALANAECVVHIAALHGIDETVDGENRLTFWDLNMNGTAKLLEYSRRLDIEKHIFISSTSVDNANSYYGQTKRSNEDWYEFYYRTSSMRVLTLRPRAFIPAWSPVYESFVDWAKWFSKGAVHLVDVAQAVVRAVDGMQALRNVPLFSELNDEQQAQALSHAPLDLDASYVDLLGELSQWDAQGAGSSFAKAYPDFLALANKHGLTMSRQPKILGFEDAQAVLGYQPIYDYRHMLEDLAEFDRTGEVSRQALEI